MKKLTKQILLALVLATSLFAFAACGDKQPATDTTGNSTVSANLDTDTNLADNSDSDTAETNSTVTAVHTVSPHPETVCTINGVELTFPSLTLDELTTQLGYFNPATIELDYNTSAVASVTKGEDAIYFSVMNLTEEGKKLPIKDCHVIGFTFDDDFAGDITATIRGITLGSTEQQMLDAFTDCEMLLYEDFPDVDGSTVSRYTFTLKNEANQYDHSFTFDVQKGVVKYVAMTDGELVNYNF